MISRKKFLIGLLILIVVLLLLYFSTSMQTDNFKGALVHPNELTTPADKDTRFLYLYKNSVVSVTAKPNLKLEGKVNIQRPQINLTPAERKQLPEFTPQIWQQLRLQYDLYTLSKDDKAALLKQIAELQSELQ